MTSDQQPRQQVSTSVRPPQPSRGRYYKRIALLTVWLGLLAVFGSAFWIDERSNLADLSVIIAHVEPVLLIAALATVPLALTLTVEIYHTLLQRLGIPVSRSAVWRAHLRSLVVGMSGPLGGPSAVVVFVRSLAARGVPTDDGCS
jgi:hypothetical protein